MTMEGSIPPKCADIPFHGCVGITAVYVPDGAADRYKEAWRGKARYIVEHTHDYIYMMDRTADSMTIRLECRCGDRINAGIPAGDGTTITESADHDLSLIQTENSAQKDRGSTPPKSYAVHMMIYVLSACLLVKWKLLNKEKSM